MQPDSIIPDQTNPQSWNRFSYVGNNPVLLNDPTGHFRCSSDPNSDDYCPGRSGGSGGGSGGNGGGGNSCDSQTPSVVCRPERDPEPQLPITMPNSEIPSQPTLRPLIPEFDFIAPWEFGRLDAFGPTFDLTWCFVVICGVAGLSWIQNDVTGESTVFFNFGGGGGLGWGRAASAGLVLAYDAHDNSSLSGLATNTGVNITLGRGGQITYGVSEGSDVSGNYAQTYTGSVGLGGQASGHRYITNSVPLFTCVFGNNCHEGVGVR